MPMKCSSAVFMAGSKLFRTKRNFCKNILLSPGRRVYDVHRHSSAHFKRPPLVFADIDDAETARALVLQLNPEGRTLVLAEINKMIAEEKQSGVDNVGHLDPEEVKNLFLFNALPFVGFGFLDNFIMIVAGEYIDVKLGATLAISTMAAAAMGNLVSDVAGIGLSGYVEILVNKIGIAHPQLTLAQSNSWKARWTQTGGRTIGIIVGCLIGMLPLLFYDEAKEKSKTSDENE